MRALHLRVGVRRELRCVLDRADEQVRLARAAAAGDREQR
jgi:hypothetical protein